MPSNPLRSWPWLFVTLLAACAPALATPTATVVLVTTTLAPVTEAIAPSPVMAQATVDLPTLATNAAATLIPAATNAQATLAVAATHAAATLTAATVSPTATPTAPPPTATFTPAATLTPVLPTLPPPTLGPVSYVPTAVSVWNTVVPPGTLSGACAGSVVNPTYGLVQITPNGDTLGWRNQEPAPYTLSKTALNTYAYTGPTALGDGTVTMVVVFTSATTLQMTRTFVANAEPGCTHIHQYSGTFQW